MLWVIGGWGNRPDPLEAAVDRLQRSLTEFPLEPEKYGSWGFWRRRNESDEGSDLDFEPTDVDDPAALAEIITAATDQVRRGPNTAPGVYVNLSRPAVSPPTPTSPEWFKYSVRVGFLDRPRPHNHIALDLDDNTDERALMEYMSALVRAWQPDHLGAVTFEVARQQGQKSQQAAVGRLTYIRDGVPLNISVLGDRIDAAQSDGGTYIRIPGTPENPSLDHIVQVRRALGYADA